MGSAISNCFLRLISIVLLLPGFHHATAQIAPGKTAAPLKKTSTPPPRPAVPQELVIPFWSLEPGWDTYLEVRNNLASSSLDITPVLRTPDGTEFPLSPVKLGSDRARKIDLQAAAPSLNGRGGS
ncbi:MAG: hypothetical protein LAN64_20050 [Acidobacteriia bacterium]|nr:hypothetical protein [Terriglobia bacterium]